MSAFPIFHASCYRHTVLQPKSEVLAHSVDLRLSSCRLVPTFVNMEGKTKAFRLHSRGYPSPPGCKAGHVSITAKVVTNRMCSGFERVRQLHQTICYLDLAALLGEFVGNFMLF